MSASWRRQPVAWLIRTADGDCDFHAFHHQANHELHPASLAALFSGVLRTTTFGTLSASSRALACNPTRELDETAHKQWCPYWCRAARRVLSQSAPICRMWRSARLSVRGSKNAETPRRAGFVAVWWRCAEVREGGLEPPRPLDTRS